MEDGKHEDQVPSEIRKQDQKDRLSSWLLEKLDYCDKTKKNDYEDDWEAYDRMARAEYLEYYDEDDPNEDWKSQLYYNIAEQKRLSAVAQLEDILGATGKFPFSISETPESESPAQINQALKKMGVDMEELLADARKKIDDHLLESKSYKELKRIIHDASHYGSGIIKSPYAYMDKKRIVDMDITSQMPDLPSQDGKLLPEGESRRDEWLKTDVLPKMILEDVERLGIKRVRPGDVFPDPSCEGDFQKGFGVFERNFYSPHVLRKMADEKIDLGDGNEKVYKYDREAILRILKANKNSTDQAGESETESLKNGQRHSIDGDDSDYKGIPIYTFHGDIMRNEVTYALHTPINETSNIDEELSEFDTVSVIIDFSKEGDVIRVIENPNPSGQRCLHKWDWEEVDGRMFGRGIFEKLRDLQEEWNRFVTTWIDNKIMSAGVIIGIVASKMDTDRGENMKFYPNKVVFLREGDRIKDMLDIFNIPDVSDTFMPAFNQLMMMIDYESGVPKIIQGQGDVAAKTAFETQQREAHALKQLGSVVKNMDEAIINSIEMIYQHMLVYGEGNDRIYGDFKIHATGFATFESKRLKMMEIDMLLQMAFSNPSIEMYFDIMKLIKKKVELIGVDPEEFTLSMEEVQKKMQERSQTEQNQMIQALQQQLQLKQADYQGKIALEEKKGEVKAALEEADRQFEASENDADRDQSIKIKLMDLEDNERGRRIGPPEKDEGRRIGPR